MARPLLPESSVQSLLQKHQIATLDELKTAVGTSATMTVFRKLKALGYRTSYSHRGKYYTLASRPDFDEEGLWSCRSVWFSRYGNLLDTTKHWIDQAQAGFTAGELQNRLHVEVKEPLLELYRRKEIQREQIEGVYVYLTRDSGQRRSQRLHRQECPLATDIGAAGLSLAASQELKAAIILFFSLLDERQRRLYAGLESFKLGHGGDRQMSDFLELDVHTVSRGRQELFGGQVQPQRVRKQGGGRHRVEKKRRKSSRRSDD
jgi:hypothetical protein